jgi:hypothetical protein
MFKESTGVHCARYTGLHPYYVPFFPTYQLDIRGTLGEFGISELGNHCSHGVQLRPYDAPNKATRLQNGAHTL